MIHCLIIDDNLPSVYPLISFLEGKAEEFSLFYPQNKNCEDMEKELASSLPWRPNVVLLDLMFAKNPAGSVAELGGLFFLEHLLEGDMEPKIPRQTPIVCLSGYEYIEKFKKEHGHKIFKILPKPMNIFAVVEAIKAASKSRQ